MGEVRRAGGSCGCGGVEASAGAYSDFRRGGWWSDGEQPASDWLRARRFAASVLSGEPPSLADARQDAAALLRLMPKEADPEARYLDPFVPASALGLGLEPGQLFVVGATALGLLGEALPERLDALLLNAAAVDLEAWNLRIVLGGGRPVFEPPVVPPEWLQPPPKLREALCWGSIIKAAHHLGGFAPPTSDAVGVTGLSSGHGCPSERLVIFGSGFGGKAPDGTSVLVPTVGGGCRSAKVLDWSEKAITVELPADVGPGCVGFLRAGNPAPLEAIDQLAGEISRCLGPGLVAWAGRLGDLGIGPTPCPPCLPLDANRLLSGGTPVIAHFGASAAVVEPGTPVTLSWSVGNATSVSLSKLSASGPWSPAPQPLPDSGTLALGPFVGLRPEVATYVLTASNACGRSQRVLTVMLSRRPPLAVTGIEVVQAVQRADNSLPLVAGRRSSVRVFLSSGLSDGFDLGAGPNRLPDVVGRLTVFDRAHNLRFDVPAAWNQPQAAPAVADRQVADGALHFELPLQACQGDVELQASVTAALPGGWVAAASGVLAARFVPKPRQEILPLLVADNATPLPAPGLTGLLDNLEGCMAYQPFAVDGFLVNPPLSLPLPATIDLRRQADWSLLTALLTTAIITGPTSAGMRCAIVPQSGAYPWGGMAVPRILVTVPALISQASSPSVFAHEVGHAYGLMHVDCGGPAGPFDARLPLTTDEPGIDAATHAFMAAGAAELMAYCSPDWTSTAHWNLVFNAIPV